MSQTTTRDGTTIDDDGQRLVLRFKERRPVGVVMITVAGIIGSGVAYQALDVGISTTSLIVTALLLLALLTLGVASVASTTTLTVTDELVTRERGPLTLSRRVELPKGGLSGIEVEKIKHSSSGTGAVHYTYAVRVEHETMGSKRLLNLGKAEAQARFLCETIRARLGLPAPDAAEHQEA